MNFEKIWATIEGNIAKHGRTVISVGDFAYTVGNCLQGKPEVLMYGLPASMATQLLNDVTPFLPLANARQADPIDAPILAGGYKAQLMEVTAQLLKPGLADSSEYIVRPEDFIAPSGFVPNLALHFAKKNGIKMRDFQLMCLFYQDANHLYPWQPGSSLTHPLVSSTH